MNDISISDSILDFTYTLAFRDATLQKSFQKWDDELEESFHERKKRIKCELKSIVHGYIDRVFDGDIKVMVPQMFIS